MEPTSVIIGRVFEEPKRFDKTSATFSVKVLERNKKPIVYRVLAKDKLSEIALNHISVNDLICVEGSKIKNNRTIAKEIVLLRTTDVKL